MKLPDLAATIARIRKNGPKEFYEGETARLIAEDMKANGGFMTLGDLKAYQAIEKEPLEGVYRGNKIVTMPPSSSGCGWWRSRRKTIRARLCIRGRSRCIWRNI